MTRRYALAICTLLGVVCLLASASASANTNRDAYARVQVQWGATSLPLVAQLEYRAALAAEREGDRDAAVTHLERAIAMAPAYPDAYFTMSRIKFRQFDPDALYFLVRGAKAMAANFGAQSLLTLNLVLFAALALVVAASIMLLALAFRYLPFAAHRISEQLDRRFRAAMPRATAYLILSIPFALFPGFVTGACVLLLITWHFMQRRERAGVLALLLPLIAMGMFSAQLERLSPLAAPDSFTSHASRSTHSSGDPELIRKIARCDIDALAAPRDNVLGMLYLRQEEYDRAAGYFLDAIELEPGNADAYVNLGNVYYHNGLWNKALEGYRKAVALDSLDAVAQYNLAQAYIKTLLMAESSHALHQASERGIDRVRTTFATPALPYLEVYPKVLSPGALWRIASTEGAAHPTAFVANALEPALGFPLRASAWLLVGALVVALILSRAIKRRHLAFQCSNCGELMCESCGGEDRGSFVCATCHSVIAEVSSEKVVDALLRQRRQKVVVRRRKLVRLATVWVPGLRDLYYGNVARGTGVALLFGASLLGLWARGYLWPDWNALPAPTPMWKWILPACGIVLAYLISAASKRLVEVRNYRTPERAGRANENEEPRQQAQTA
jgi:tetratricopeptide (TPR) repeat protein